MKKVLIGEITKKRLGHYQVDSVELGKPFEWDRAVSRNFCTNCGTTVEIGPDYARHLMAIANYQVTSLDELKEIYFETTGCGSCKKGGPMTAEAKRIITKKRAIAPQ
ncbi:MAG: hypothetical protein NTX66_01935 [Candidatus Falkowbacteria bacterium]|nr:hypothetical protein [Candidatus Falkowbacteria bacterium]